jgi:hypothetical protein
MNIHSDYITATALPSMEIASGSPQITKFLCLRSEALDHHYPHSYNQNTTNLENRLECPTPRMGGLQSETGYRDCHS